MGRAAAAGVMLALFRWEHYRQHGNQMIEVLRQIQLPARILVSSAHPAREGPWVAAVAAADRRPSSLVARATHSIAWENFAGTNYRLKTRNEEELEAFLDRHAINVLIVDDTGEYSSVREHHTLLKRLLQSSPNWAARAHGGKIAMFRRVQPPKQPRQPFEIELRNRRRTIVEQY